APEEQRARPQRARGKGGTPVLSFPVFRPPSEASHSERLTTHKIRRSLLRRQVRSAPWIFVGGQA
ncbi:hypothetical protein, partial [Citrobacter braakii]